MGYEIKHTFFIFPTPFLDRPSPPKGPLQPDNITKDSCQLSWNPPEDDGGSEITNYVVEKREVGTTTWVPVSAFTPGTACSVQKLQEGKEYEFRVCAENAFGRSDPLNTDHPILAKDPYGTPGKPGKVGLGFRGFLGTKFV